MKSRWGEELYPRIFTLSTGISFCEKKNSINTQGKTQIDTWYFWNVTIWEDSYGASVNIAL